MKKYTLISLFAGVSGSSLGFLRTGRINEVLAVDCDSFVVKCFKENFPNVPVYSEPLNENITGGHLLRFVNEEYQRLNGVPISLNTGEVDILFASPPCQGFSTARGIRNVDDERNTLFFETIRYIQEIQPLVFIIENVKGIVVGKMKPKFNQIIEEIEKLSYDYKYKILNAAHYGVPQLRERIFFIGVREDLGISPKFPPVSNRDLQKLALCRKVKDVDFFTSGQFAKTIYPSTEVCRTITAGASMKFWKDGIPRKPSISEVKTLCSFPTTYKLWSEKKGMNPRNKLDYNFTKKWKGLGNSVPPKLMEAVANTVITEILDIHFNKKEVYNVLP